MSGDLVERVARAMADSCGVRQLEWPEFILEARAAIRVVVEECARVAEAQAIPGEDPYIRICAAGIAVYIRALLETGK